MEGQDNSEGNIAIKKETLWKYSAAILFVVIVLVAIVMLNSKGDSPSTPTGFAVVEIGKSPIEGSADAPVTIVEFSDFECPYCGRNYRQTYPEIKKNYIDTGKVKYSFKDFPLEFHKDAQKASEAARCVREQLGDEGFWNMHDRLYENQGSLSVENYKKWAIELGADGNKFDSCLDSGKYAQSIKEDLAFGKSIGVEGTPAFFINGKPIIGACPYKTFQQAIDAEIAGKDWSVNQCKISIG